MIANYWFLIVTLKLGSHHQYDTSTRPQTAFVWDEASKRMLLRMERHLGKDIESCCWLITTVGGFRKTKNTQMIRPTTKTEHMKIKIHNKDKTNTKYIKRTQMRKQYKPMKLEPIRGPSGDHPVATRHRCPKPALSL